jgi:phosphatidylglycerol:prolipoprotein diacylglycerol transferase
MIKPVSAFSLLVGMAVALGLGWSLAQAGARYAERLLNLGVAVLLAALILSRVFFVFPNWGYYRTHLLETLWVWQGGLSGSGALLGGCLGILLAAWVAKVSPGWLADQLLPLLACLVVAGWLGSWLAGNAYGAVSRAWWALPAVDEWGISDHRLPVQFTGAMLSVFCLGWLERQRGLARWPGLAACLGLFASAAILFGLSFLRADPMPFWAGLRLDAWGALAALAASLILGIICFLSTQQERL